MKLTPRELQERNGLTFAPNQKIPYTGEVRDNDTRKAVLFIDGVITRVTSWYENGQKKEESFYKDGKLDGEMTKWLSNGQKEEESFYKDGKLDGEMTKWLSDDQKGEESFYKDGKLDGEVIKWWSDGQKKEESFYKDGFRVGESTCWDEAGRKIITNSELPYYVALFLSILLTYLIIDRYILIDTFYILLVAGLFFLLVIWLLLRNVVDRLNYHDKSRGDYAVAFTVIFIYAFVTSHLIHNALT